MADILNITNGDSAVELMNKAGIPGDHLPWRDVVHEGPVPGHLSLTELSEVRARYIADQDWGDFEEVLESFTERDEALFACADYDKIVLWFEHDLYDQLQILQILDWFHHHPDCAGSLSMVCTDQYLGMQTPEQFKHLQRHEAPVTTGQLTLAAHAWAAFRSDSPMDWCELLKEDTSALPFLNGAVLRMLEEYPSCTTGLSRTATQALTAISEGEARPGKAFAASQEQEERMFLGDWSFWMLLQEMIDSQPPLLVLHEGTTLERPPTVKPQELSITQSGRAVLSGEQTWLEITKPDHWIGGVHLKPDNLWCWDSGSRTVQKMPE